MSVYDFAVDAPSSSDLSKVYLFPNPLYAEQGHNSLKIENITGRVEVEIYTIEGQLVHSQSVENAGDEVWDLLSNKGIVVSSGIYLVRIRTSDAATVKQIAVIR